MEDRHLSLSEVADVMGVSERTVHRWIKSGKLKSYKPGRDHRIPESGLREFIEESEVYPKVREPQPKFRAAAQPDEWQESLARLYKATIKEGRAALRTPKPDFERVRVFHEYTAGLAKIHGPRDILGRESDALAEAVAELEDLEDQIQTRIQEWFVGAPEDEQSSALEQLEGTAYGERLRAVR